MFHKQRYLVQRLDDERFFVHPSDDEGLRQWVKDPLQAHQWCDLDSCNAAARTSQMVWGIPAKVHTLALPL